MSILTIVKHWLPSKRKAALSRIKDFPEAQRLDELGKAFYAECLEQSVRFVQEHVSRGDDSPFRGLPRERFFHEIMAVTFWALERRLEEKHRPLMERVYAQYQRSFHGGSAANGTPPEWMRERFRSYNASWNDVTGHHDQFGRAVAESLFAGGQAYSAPETSFWIIEYADALQGEFGEMRDLCRSMQLGVI